MNTTATRTRAWVEIDLGAIERNLRAFRRHIGEDVKVCAVIKADGYGHGAVPVARRLLAGPSAGAAWGAAADVREGIELRQAGIDTPVLLLGALAPPEYEAAAAHDLTISVHSAASVDHARDAAAKTGRRVRVHLKIDTGMARLGAPPAEAVDLAGRIRAVPGLAFEGLFTHFSSAGSLDKGAMREQLVAFRGAVDRLEKAGLRPPVLHAANSAAALAFPETRFGLVRPGIVLYGIDPGGICARLGWRPEPALALRARIAHVKPIAVERTVGYERRWRATRDTRIATVPLGYADSYPFALTNTGSALVRGRRVPVVGSVTMDYVMLDVGAVPEAQEGDVATFIGRDGAEEIRVEDLAGKASTIPYEIICGIGRRVERVYTT
jgi:alanine racemase